MRLAHFLSRAGVTSRRKAEEIVREGLVCVNGEPVVDPAFAVDPGSDEVKVDEKRVKLPSEYVYYLLHKPKGVVTSEAPQGQRKTVFDLVPPEPRVFAAGRLDVDSSGLLLLTNDGDLVEKLTHPRYEVEKTYRVRADGELAEGALKKLMGGIHLAEGKVRGKFRVIKRGRGFVVLDVTLMQGANRQVRRMLAKVGLKVRSLLRTDFGPFHLSKLPVGSYRLLSPQKARAALVEANKAGKKARGHQGGGGRKRR